MEETTDRPKWLVELENRKRKPRLAHEAGAGSPCTVCNSACPGLDLHFWRKICKNCKCSRDDHDVDDDDFPQFDLLFGSTGKFKKKSILLRVDKEKRNDAEAAFEWVPPDTTEELAADYMKALPEDKLPIQGSAGAALRRQLLQKQLPLHDIDHNACDELTECERKQFEKYLENLKRYVGQGKVTKMLAARPFNRVFVTPANATDMRRFGPRCDARSPASLVHLRTPSSFNPKIPVKSNMPELQGNTETIREPERYDCILNDVFTGGEVARSERLNHDFYPSPRSPNSKLHDSSGRSIRVHNNETQIPSSTDNEGLPSMESCSLTEENSLESSLRRSDGNRKEEIDKVGQNLTNLEDVNRRDGMLAEAILADALLPPSAIHSNDIIGSTLDKKELNYIREKLSNKYSTQENSVVPGTRALSRPLNDNKAKRDVLDPDKDADGVNIRGTRSSEVIPVSEKNIVEKDEKTKLNNNPLHETRLPLTNVKDGEKKILSSPIRSELIKTGYPEGRLCTTGNVESRVVCSESLKNQVFPHEATVIAERANLEAPKEDTEGSVTNAAKVGKCRKCQEEIRIGDVVVTAEKAKNESWHPGCFTCSVCNELLVDLVYFYYKNQLYCGRDLATLLGIPRCFACDELIFVQEYTVAEGHNYHVKHFCCWDCDIPLAGKRYVSENDRPLCLPCYQKTYAKTCNACNVLIAADQRGVAVKHLNFHAVETCFCCYNCKKNLLNGRMAVKEDKLFCSRECITEFLNLDSSA